ncbi:MAG: metallophosphoesterase [Halanaerobiales bacterium]|nr:metallophosphoesterase [Halanaerobiales bacterium]
MQKNNKFITIEATNDYRLIAVSDIHGAAHLINQLLDKVRLQEKDYLVVVGDSIERGKYNVEMIDFLKELSKRENTFILSGNWEESLLDVLLSENKADILLNYSKSVSYPSTLKVWAERLGIDLFDVEDSKTFQKRLVNSYKEDIEFLNSFPLALELDNFIFVHAGIDNIKNWKDSDPEVLLSCPEFLNKKHCIDKYVVVGHWPTSNYRNNSINSDIIIDEDKKIISLDGGYGVKSTGQLNALIIEKNGDEYKFLTESIDDLKLYKVQETQNIQDNSNVKVSWQDNAIEVLKKKNEFSLCRKVSTNEKLLIKNEFIKKKGEGYICNDDYVSLFLNVKEGEIVKVVDYYGQYALAKYENEFGWIHKNKLISL